MLCPERGSRLRDDARLHDAWIEALKSWEEIRVAMANDQREAFAAAVGRHRLHMDGVAAASIAKRERDGV